MLKEESKKRPTPPILTLIPLPLLTEKLQEKVEKDENSSESDDRIIDKDDVVLSGIGTTMLHRHSLCRSAAISTNNADENREWKNISFSERKEETDEEEKVIVNSSPLPIIIPTDNHLVPVSVPTTPPFGSAQWAIKEASRLRALGVRRAIEKVLFGASATIIEPPRAPADVLRAWNPAARATTLSAPRVADEPRQILAAARRRWRIVRALRRAAVAPSLPIPLPTDAPLPPRDFRDFAPHNVLPFGPLALPNGRLASEAPSLILARVRRGVSANERAAKLADPHAARAASASRSRTPTVLRKRSSRTPSTHHTPSVADVAAWKEYDTARRDYFKAVAEVARADAMARTIAAAEADAVAKLHNYSSSEDDILDDTVKQQKVVVEEEDEENLGLIIASQPTLKQLASDTLLGSTPSAEKISAVTQVQSVSPFTRTARAFQRAKDLRLAGEEDNVRRLRGRSSE